MSASIPISQLSLIREDFVNRNHLKINANNSQRTSASQPYQTQITQSGNYSEDSFPEAPNFYFSIPKFQLLSSRHSAPFNPSLWYLSSLPKPPPPPKRVASLTQFLFPARQTSRPRNAHRSNNRLPLLQHLDASYGTAPSPSHCSSLFPSHLNLPPQPTLLSLTLSSPSSTKATPCTPTSPPASGPSASP